MGDTDARTHIHTLYLISLSHSHTNTTKRLILLDVVGLCEGNFVAA